MLRGLAWFLFALWSVLLIAWLTLHWGILDHIDEWRPQIEARASRALGSNVRIGRIAVHSGGWVPSVELEQVVLIDAAGREALRLPRVLAALSPRSLLALSPRLEQLLVDGAELSVRRDAAGRWHVGGFDVEGPALSGEGQSNAGLDWFLRQHEFVVRQGRLRYVDELRPGAPVLELEAIDLVVRNGLLQHDLRLDATPPPAWGERFSLIGRFRQPLLAAPSEWQRWSGTLQAELPRADVHALRRHVALPVEVMRGEGAVRGWFEVKSGALREATLDLALRDLELRAANGLEPLAFAELEGRVRAARTADGVEFAAEHFGFALGDGLLWPKGELRLALRQRESPPGATAAEPIAGGAASADRIDLALLAAIAGRLPLPDGLRGVLVATAPRGVIRNLDARWDGPPDAPARYAAKVRIEGLAVAAQPASAPGKGGTGSPGVAGLTLDVASATERGGRAQLSIADGAVELPGVMQPARLALERASAQLAWSLGPDRRLAEVQLREASFANADAEGSLGGVWRSGTGAERFPGQLELDARLVRGQAASVARYLPLGLPESVRSYLGRAVTAGSITQASFHVKGELAQFPFLHGKPGEFKVVAQLADLAFAYVPPAAAGGALEWPALSQLSGELAFDRGTMEIRNASAKVGGYELLGVQGGIRNLADRAPLLALEGRGRGALADALGFVAASPVGRWIGDALAPATATGSAELQLALEVPLAEVSQTQVRGSVLFGGNDLRLRPDMPLLAAARGRVDFSRKGFAVAGGGARVLGGELAFEGGSQPDGSVRFTGNGTMTAEALRRAGELGLVSHLAGAMNGQSSYRLGLGFGKAGTEIQVTSSLTGLALDLPAPLGKAAEASLPLRYESRLVGDAGADAAPRAARESGRLDLGSTLQALWQREAPATGREMRLVRAAVGVLEPPPPLPARGLHANATLPSVDLEAWEAVAGRLLPAPAKAEAAGAARSEAAGPARNEAAASKGEATGSKGEAAGSKGEVAGSKGEVVGSKGEATASSGEAASAVAEAADDDLPQQIALRAQQLSYGSRHLHRVVAGLTHAEGVWRANVDAEELSGLIEYRPPRRNGAGLVQARLSRLTIAGSESHGVEQLIDRPAAASAPQSAPALDIVVDDFRLGAKKLGKVEVEATNRRPPGDESPRGSPRDWRLTRLAITVPEAHLAATGTWAAADKPGARRRMVLDFTLDVADSGALLDRLGTPKAVREGKGKLAGRIGWLGSPFSLDYPTLSGQINVAVQAGQFLKADPGAARLLGVLSLQSLPRRLLFDFRDVFEEGFAFDEVSGDVSIDKGIASTRNLRIRGVQAVVLMEGEANLERETQDLKVVVVPEINAGTASLAYAAINPAIGLGTFLAQLFLRKPLAAASTREFHVYGSWDDPKVEKVERKTGSADSPSSRPP